MTVKTIVFEEYFELGQQETLSPFITPRSRQWGANLSLKSALLAALLLAISFFLSFISQALPLSHWLLVVVYFLAGIPSLIESLEDLSNLEVNIDVLMTLAAFSSVFIGSGMEGGLLLVLFSLSGAMEEAVATRAKSAISSLHQLAPTTALVIKNGGEAFVERSVKEIAVGELILVKSGQVVPLDGKVIRGASSVNLVHLTGESVPVTKTKGSAVPAGAQNLEGALVLEVERTSSDSTLARIIQLVTQAQEAKPRLQQWFDAVSKQYAAMIILLSCSFALLLPTLLQIPFFGSEGSIYRALAFLIAASPCALIIALPIAYLSSISICARRGILLKGGISLDALAACRAIAFDKTGTLTTGELTCLGMEVLGSAPSTVEKEALDVALSLEYNAIHPIAKALVNYAKEQQATPVSLESFKAVPGYGLEGKAHNFQAFIGRPEYIFEQIPPAARDLLRNRIQEIQKQGEMVAVLSWKEKLFLFRFRDTLRSKIGRTLVALKKRWKMQIVMLTGDHATSAERIAKELKIDNWQADLTPEDKLNQVAALSREFGLAMVGDGINDAPALARSTVGICMGKVGTTTAMDASDIVLLHDNIELLDWLVGKARQTQIIVKQNLSLAIAAILFASIPALMGSVPLWLAVVMHEGGTVLVGLNALRLLRI